MTGPSVATASAAQRALGPSSALAFSAAGRPGDNSKNTPRCPQGTVMLGLSPRRYSATLGSNSVLTGILNNITAVCGVPKTTGVCAPK